MNGEIFLPAIAAGLIALFVPFILRPILSRLGVLDVPNHRSSHNQPVLRGGGVAPLLGLSLGGLVFLALGTDSSNTLFFLMSVLLASFMALVGLIEDVRGIPVKIRASLQLFVGIVLGSIAILTSSNSFLWIPLIAIAFAYHVNLTNFMDGINGISGFHGAVAGISLALLGYFNSISWLISFGLIVAFVFISFLPWNFIPPRIFLGDVGSYLLGGAVGTAGVFAMVQGVHPFAVFSVVSIYWIDASTTLLCRFFKGEPIFQAHRSHLYQRLVDYGLSHMQVSVLVTVFSSIAAGAGIAVERNLLPALAGILCVGIVVFIYLMIPTVMGIRQSHKPKYEMVRSDSPVPVGPRDRWNPRTWAVFGAGGFVGSSVVEYLEKSGYKVVQIPAPRLRFPESNPSVDDTIACARDINTEEIEKCLVGVDVIINAAGVAAPTGSADDSLYGANALLPAVLALLSERAQIPRMIHLSSAAVQGAREVLTATPEVEPFSPYSHSKALGEQVLLELRKRITDTDLLLIRATSVQGRHRPTTISLKRIARSPLASVAAPGTQPTVVSSIDMLVKFIHAVGKNPSEMEVILLQPWERMNVKEVLEVAGGKTPIVLPQWLCWGLLSLGRAFARFIPRFSGVVRRLELMWFGQKQESDAVLILDGIDSRLLKSILRSGTQSTDHEKRETQSY